MFFHVGLSPNASATLLLKAAKPNLGFAGGLPVLAIGPKGGKIVGWKSGKPIYAGSSAAKKLSEMKKQASQTVKPGPGSVLKDHAKQAISWLMELGVPSVLMGNDTHLLMSNANAEKVTDAFGVKGAKATSASTAIGIEDLWPHVGHPLKPKDDDLTVLAAEASVAKPDGSDPFADVGSLQVVAPLGGSHGGKIAVTSTGEKFAWKVNHGQLWVSRAEEAFNRVAKLVFPKPELYSDAKVLSHNGDTGVLLSWIPNDGTIGSEESGNHGTTKEVLQENFTQLVQHQVLDWMMSNHDSHGANFVFAKTGGVAAIDKGQAFKAIGHDELSDSYKLNNSSPVYNAMWKAYQKDPSGFGDPVAAVAEMLDSIEKNLSLEQYHQLVNPYLLELEAGLKISAATKWKEIKKRFEDMRSDWQSFLEKMTGGPVDFNAHLPEPVAPPPVHEVHDEGGKAVGVQDTPGWPVTKGAVTVHSPGGPVPPGIKWPKKYPGPGYASTVVYKGTPINFEFSVDPVKSKAQVSVKFPDMDPVMFKSPAAAADAVLLWDKGLDLNTSSTKKKELGIAYSATTLFNLKAFNNDLTAATSLPQAQDKTIAQKSVEEIDADAAKKQAPIPSTLPAAALLKGVEGEVSDTSVLPHVIQKVVDKVSGPHPGTDNWEGFPPPGTVVCFDFWNDGAPTLYVLCKDTTGAPACELFHVKDNVAQSDGVHAITPSSEFADPLPKEVIAALEKIGAAYVKPADTTDTTPGNTEAEDGFDGFNEESSAAAPVGMSYEFEKVSSGAVAIVTKEGKNAWSLKVGTGAPVSLTDAAAAKVLNNSMEGVVKKTTVLKKLVDPTEGAPPPSADHAYAEFDAETLQNMEPGTVLKLPNGLKWTKNSGAGWTGGAPGKADHTITSSWLENLCSSEPATSVQVELPVAMAPPPTNPLMEWEGSKPLMDIPKSSLEALPAGTVVLTEYPASSPMSISAGNWGYWEKLPSGKWKSQKGATMSQPSSSAEAYKASVTIVDQKGVVVWSGAHQPSPAQLDALPVGTEVFNTNTSDSYTKKDDGSWLVKSVDDDDEEEEIDLGYFASFFSSAPPKDNKTTSMALASSGHFLGIKVLGNTEAEPLAVASEETPTTEKEEFEAMAVTQAMIAFAAEQADKMNWASPSPKAPPAPQALTASGVKAVTIAGVKQTLNTTSGFSAYDHQKTAATLTQMEQVLATPKMTFHDENVSCYAPSPKWPNWVPPVGLFLKGTVAGKEMYLVNSVSGYSVDIMSSEPQSDIKFGVLFDGTLYPGAKTPKSLIALRTAVNKAIKAANPKAKALTAKECFDAFNLKGAIFDKKKTALEYDAAPTIDQVVTSPQEAEKAADEQVMATLPFALVLTDPEWSVGAFGGVFKTQTIGSNQTKITFTVDAPNVHAASKLKLALNEIGMDSSDHGKIEHHGSYATVSVPSSFLAKPYAVKMPVKKVMASTPAVPSTDIDVDYHPVIFANSNMKVSQIKDQLAGLKIGCSLLTSAGNIAVKLSPEKFETGKVGPDGKHVVEVVTLDDLAKKLHADKEGVATKPIEEWDPVPIKYKSLATLATAGANAPTPEQKAELEKQKTIAVWIGKNKPAKPKLALAYAQAAIKKAGVKEGMWAFEAPDGDYLIGSPADHSAIHASVDHWEGFAPVDTPLGILWQGSPDALAKAAGMPPEVEHGGSMYPGGTTFTDEEVPDVLVEQAVHDAIQPYGSGGDGTLKGIKAHHTDDDKVVLKFQGNTPEAKDLALAKMVELLGPNAPEALEVTSGAINTLVIVDKAKFESAMKTVVSTKIETKVKLPKLPPEFASAPLPVSAVGQVQKAGAVNNESDIHLLGAIKHGGWGHTMRYGAAGVFQNFQVSSKLVDNPDGEDYYELTGDLLNFHPDASDLSPDTIRYGYTPNSWAPYDPETGKHAKGTDDIEGGWTGYANTFDGVDVSVIFDPKTKFELDAWESDKALAFRNRLTVRVPVSKDPAAALALALEKAGVPKELVNKPHDETAERIFIKSQVVRWSNGSRGYWHDREKYADEAWLDKQIGENKLESIVADARITVGAGGAHTVESPMMASYVSNVKFVHTGASGPDAVVSAITQGIGVPSRKQGYTNGTAPHSSSASSDTRTGGAIGLFARAAGSGIPPACGCGGYNSAKVRFIYHPRVLQRLDVFVHSEDEFGSLSKHSGPPGYEYLKDDHEVLLENGVALEDVAGINCRSKDDYDEVVSGLEAAGITEVNGIPVKDFVFCVSQETHSTLEAACKGLKKSG